MIRFTAALCAGLFVSGCETSDIKGPNPTPRGVGFQCLPVPSEWMEAGSIFEVDKDGNSGRIGRVDSIQVLPEAHVAFPAYSQTSAWKIGLLLNTLEKLTNRTGWSANIGADVSSLMYTTSTYGDLRLSVTEGQPESAAERWFKSKGYQVESGKRYFFVREAIKAHEASYEIQSQDIIKLGGEAKIKELLGGTLDAFSRQSSGSYKISGKYPVRLNVCIKPREIIAFRAATGEKYLAFQDVTEVISISGTRK